MNKCNALEYSLIVIIWFIIDFFLQYFLCSFTTLDSYVYNIESGSIWAQRSVWTNHVSSAPRTPHNIACIDSHYRILILSFHSIGILCKSCCFLAPSHIHHVPYELSHNDRHVNGPHIYRFPVNMFFIYFCYYFNFIHQIENWITDVSQTAVLSTMGPMRFSSGKNGLKCCICWR